MQVEKLFFYKIKLLRQKLGQVLQESAPDRTTAAMVGKRLRSAGTCVSMAPCLNKRYRVSALPVPPLETLAMPLPTSMLLGPSFFHYRLWLMPLLILAFLILQEKFSPLQIHSLI